MPGESGTFFILLFLGLPQGKYLLRPSFSKSIITKDRSNFNDAA
jgi:hypothetical protein